MENTSAGLAISIPVIVFILTVGIGSDLKWADFKRLAQEPKTVVVGLVGQIFVLPAVAFGVAWLFRDNLVIAIGIVLLAASPSGPLSNSLVYVGRGRTELSVTLTAASGTLGLATTPLVASLGIQIFAGERSDISLPILQTIAQIFLLIIVPLIIGMLIRARWPKFITRHEGRIRNWCTLLMVLAVVILVIVAWQSLVTRLVDFAVSGLLFVVVLVIASWLYGLALGLDEATRFTILVEMVIHNIVVVAVIAVTMLKRPELALFSAVYAPPIALILLALALIRKAKVSANERSQTNRQ
jgi:BASS family bile acid:Na+ symporter